MSPGDGVSSSRNVSEAAGSCALRVGSAAPTGTEGPAPPAGSGDLVTREWMELRKMCRCGVNRIYKHEKQKGSHLFEYILFRWRTAVCSSSPVNHTAACGQDVTDIP